MNEIARELLIIARELVGTSPFFTPAEGGTAEVVKRSDGSVVEVWRIPPSPDIREGDVRKVLSSDWGRAFRQDYEEPEPMRGSDLAKVKSVKLVRNPDKRTWWMVYDKRGNYIGPVRTKVGGSQEYMVGDSKQIKHGGFYQTDRDPDHAYAILALLEEVR